MRGPVGRIGKPRQPGAFQRFEQDGVTVFVQQQLLDELEGKEPTLPVLMGDYGTWQVRFR